MGNGLHPDASCHRREVGSSVRARHPVCSSLCHWSTCRETAGAGGVASTVGAVADRLTVECADDVGRYFVRTVDGGAADQSLPDRRRQAERMLLMPGSRAEWGEADLRPCNGSFDGWADESLAAWPARTGMAQ